MVFGPLCELWMKLWHVSLAVACFKLLVAVGERERYAGGNAFLSSSTVLSLQMSFSNYMCLFQALLLLQAGSNLAADQAIKHTFINSGPNCLAITFNLVP